ncbi:MAG: hypothetical protein ACRC6V_10415 [Bacteroidales bacterium]
MSLLFGSRYRDDEDDNFSGIMASKMNRALEEDWGPVRQQRQQRRPRVVTRRRRIEEE